MCHKTKKELNFSVTRANGTSNQKRNLRHVYLRTSSSGARKPFDKSLGLQCLSNGVSLYFLQNAVNDCVRTCIHTKTVYINSKGHHTIHSRCFINAVFFPTCSSSTSVILHPFLLFLMHIKSYMWLIQI